MSGADNWKPILHDYVTEISAKSSQRTVASIHPLMDRTNKRGSASSLLSDDSDLPVVKKKEEPKAAVFDPLSALLSDPLSGMLKGGGPLPSASNAFSVPISKSVDEKNEIKEEKEKIIPQYDWGVRKEEILNDYEVEGSIKVKSNVVHTESSEPLKVALDKSKKRLEKLEKRERDYTYDVTEMSIADYKGFVDVIKNKVVVAWNKNEKVQALTEILSAIAMLEDTSQVSFYPSIFVLVSNLLDWFGDLVFDRLLQNAADKSKFAKGLTSNFTYKDVSDETREICRNWFFKISSITELLPRIYVELALIKCNQFLYPRSIYPTFLARIGQAIRGVADPLLASYCRTFVVICASKVTIPVNGPVDPVIYTMLEDYLFTFKELNNKRLDKFKPSDVKSEEYFRYFSPAVHWLLNAAAKSGSKDVFRKTIQGYRKNCNHSMVLLHILEAFNADVYNDNVLSIVELIKSSEGETVPQVALYAALGRALIKHPPPEDQRLALLNEVWKYVKGVAHLQGYAKCVSVYVELLLLHYSEREVNILLKDLVKHVKDIDTESKKSIMIYLEKIVNLVVEHAKDFGAIITSEHFLAVMFIFRGTKQMEIICKNMLTNFNSRQQGTTSDPVLIHELFDFARSLHDSLDSLSFDDEVKQIGTLICGFIDRVDFGNDLEQLLNFYVDCRAGFANLDAVLSRLVMCVYSLSMRAHKMVKGKHNKKTGAFTKACLAYCFVTIPSVSDLVKQLHLNLLCGQACLINESLSQADDFFKQAISLIPDIPAYIEVDHKRVHTESLMLGFVQNFCSSLVIMPGHPEFGPFYLIRGLLNALAKYEWQENSGVKLNAYISVIPLLCVYAQRKHPYHVAGIASNDELFGGNAEFIQELQGYILTTVEDASSQLLEIMEDTKTLPGVGGALALDFANQLLFSFECQVSSASFMSRMMKLSLKNVESLKTTDKVYLNNTLSSIHKQVKSFESRGRTKHEAFFEALSRTMPQKI